MSVESAAIVVLIVTCTFIAAASPAAATSGFNFASSVAGAKVLAASPGIWTAQACLNPDPDEYLMIDRDNRRVEWLAIQLSEDISPRRIILQNLEYYATSPMQIQVLASSLWPTERWALLGVLTVNRTRQAQAFAIDSDKVFRYLKLRILSIHEIDRFCTLTSFQVFGIPALQPAVTDAEEVEIGIEQLIRFSSRYSHLPQPIYLARNGNEACAAPAASLLADPMLANALQQSFPDLNSVWDLAGDTRSTEHGTVYAALMSRLHSIGARQRFLDGNAQAFVERSKGFLSQIRDQLAGLEKKIVQVDGKQRTQLQAHSDLFQSSRLHLQSALLKAAIPRLEERAEQFQDELNFVIYLGIVGAIVSVLLIVILICTY